MQDLINEMLNLPKWAIVGATKSKDKFGYRIWKKLKESGYQTYMVNPVYNEIEGERCFLDLKSLPVVPDCISIVVPPEKARDYIKEAIALGVKRIWFQPGTFDKEIIHYAEENGILTVFYNCVLVELDKAGK